MSSSYDFGKFCAREVLTNNDEEFVFPLFRIKPSIPGTRLKPDYHCPYLGPSDLRKQPL